MSWQLRQMLLALAYYFMLVLLMRLAGKRLAGQTTSFDLLILISLGVVLQNVTLKDGDGNALIFVVTVFATHRGMTAACARWPALRRIVRGGPRVLVRDGKVLLDALAAEGLTEADLLAGLRKLGFDAPESVKLASIEETGHIAAVGP